MTEKNRQLEKLKKDLKNFSSLKSSFKPKNRLIPIDAPDKEKSIEKEKKEKPKLPLKFKWFKKGESWEQIEVIPHRNEKALEKEISMDPLVVSKKPNCPLNRPKQFRKERSGSKKAQWYVMYYEEVKIEGEEPYKDGEVIARMDVVHVSTGLIIQNCTQVKYANGDVFMIPSYRKECIRDGRPKKLPYLRFKARCNIDIFQLAVEEYVNEMCDLNPERLSSRCRATIPQDVRQRCLDFFQVVKESQQKKKADSSPSK